MIFKGPNLTSTQGQRSRTTGAEQISSVKFTHNLEPEEVATVCLQVLACEPQQVQRLTVQCNVHCLGLSEILTATSLT